MPALRVQIPQVLWGVGVPYSIYSMLKKFDGHHRDPLVRRTYGFFYDGYENDFWYYECVVMLRKMLFIGLVNALPFNIAAKSITLLLVAVLFVVMHIFLQPFDNRGFLILDRLEAVSLFAITASIMCRSVNWCSAHPQLL